MGILIKNIIISIDNGRNSRDPTRHSKDGPHNPIKHNTVTHRKIVIFFVVFRMEEVFSHTSIIAKDTQLTTTRKKNIYVVEEITGEEEEEENQVRIVDRRKTIEERVEIRLTDFRNFNVIFRLLPQDWLLGIICPHVIIKGYF